MDKGLGTGENDYSVNAEFYKFVGQCTLLGSVGYRMRGEPTDVDLNDVVMASIGDTYRMSPATGIGLTFDYRESAIPENASNQELTGFVSRRICDYWRVHLYAFTGFTDSSADLGVAVGKAL